ncbi:MAG: SPASM domain-containing protein [Vulcanimicrobiaceae bacterium]
MNSRIRNLVASASNLLTGKPLLAIFEVSLRGIDALESFPGTKFLTCIVSDVNRSDVMDVVRFARARDLIPVVGAYHWNVGIYGKANDHLRYDAQLAIAVFRQVRDSGLVNAGYYRDYLNDSIRWLSKQPLASCDAGRYSIAVDASGNVAPCLAHPHSGTLRELPLDEILRRFDYAAIERCSNASTCNLACSRIVGTSLRRPVSAARTLLSFVRQR